jgi:hypothetical protein
LGYEYDVFLSYTTSSSNGAWVREHFRDLFFDRLDNVMPRQPTMFAFDGQETATAWPEQLARALRRSRVLVAVVSPPYFRSHWCVAEWASMKAREDMLRLGTESNPRLLIHPVVYADGQHFPPSARRNYSRDFSAWNYPNSSFKESPAYFAFFRAVEELALQIAGRLDDVPLWRDDFPIHLPELPPQAPPELERLY